MKIRQIGERRGYFITKNKFDEIEEIQVNGKTYYFIESVKKEKIEYDKHMIEDLLKSNTKAQIIESLGMSENQFNNYLKKTYKTTSIKKILSDI